MDNFYLKRKFLQKSIKQLNDSSLYDELSKPFEYDVKYSFQYDANIFNNKNPDEKYGICNKNDIKPNDKSRLNLDCNNFESYEKLAISIEDDNFNFVNESTKINLPKQEDLTIFKNKFKKKGKENEEPDFKKASEKTISTLHSNRIDFATSFTEFGGTHKKIKQININF